MQHKLGVLLVNGDQLGSVLGAPAPVAAPQDREPNVLALSQTKNETIGYFSLLPVMVVPSAETVGQPQQQPAKAEVSCRGPTNAGWMDGSIRVQQLMRSFIFRTRSGGVQHVR